MVSMKRRQKAGKASALHNSAGKVANVGTQPPALNAYGVPLLDTAVGEKRVAERVAADMPASKHVKPTCTAADE